MARKKTAEESPLQRALQNLLSACETSEEARRINESNIARLKQLADSMGSKTDKRNCFFCPQQSNCALRSGLYRICPKMDKNMKCLTDYLNDDALKSLSRYWRN